MKNGTTFAPIPARAIGDGALSGLDLRLLGAIALHDRMSETGRSRQGCWASHKRLAAMLGCDKSAVSRSLKRLVEWGYVQSQRNPRSRRYKVLVVHYTDEDAAIMAERNTVPEPGKGDNMSPFHENSCQIRQPSWPDSCQIRQSEEIRKNPRNISHEMAPPFGADRLGRGIAEGLSSDGANSPAVRSETPFWLDPPDLGRSDLVNAWLARIEREAKSGRIPPEDMETVAHTVGDFIEELEPGTPEWGRSARLVTNGVLAGWSDDGGEDVCV